jgi:hypothetical protein
MIATRERVTEPVAVPEIADTRSWLQERISTETAVMLAAVWYVLFVIGTALEPSVATPTPGWLVAVSVGFFSVLAVMAVGLLARRRWGVLAGLGAAGIFTALAVACPTSGHHAIAPWWFGQMACALGLVAASAVALRRPAAE